MEDLFRQNFARLRDAAQNGSKKNGESVHNPRFQGKNKACTLEEREEVCFMQNNNNRENNNQNERSQNKQQNEQRNQKENRK